MRLDYGIASFLGFQILKVGLAVVEEGFCQDCRAEGVAQEMEAGLPVGISVGPVETHPVAGEIPEGGIAQAGSQSVGRGRSTGGIAAPACGVLPFRTVAGGIAVDTDEDDVLTAESSTVVIDSAAALG